MDVWGVPWRSTRSATPAVRAAVSRALKRLEQRGLVVRSNQVSGGPWTTHVKLTEIGRTVAETVNKTLGDFVNRFDDSTEDLP
jgi:DNA-binding MarR family transcriptional regulator